MSELCEVCSRVDFHSFVAAPPQHEVNDGPWIPPKYELGTALEILRRASSCDFCELICHSLRTLDTLDVLDQCSVQQVHYCTLYENESRQSGRRLDRMAIVLTRVGSPEAGLSLGKLLLSKSYQQVSRPKIILELQICPETSEEQEVMGFGQLCGRSMDFSRVDVKLFKIWLLICEETHGKECAELNGRGGGGFHFTDGGSLRHGALMRPLVWREGLLGLLLIDVQEGCITQAPNQGRRYIALSYCWGSAPILQHTRANSDLLQQKRSLDTQNVPQTIRDAMALVKQIGERYLWVDSLCIIQDDHITSTYFVSQMDIIYSHAILTIVAAAGSNANSGLPGVREGTRDVQQSILNVSGLRLMAAIDGSYYKGVAGSDWSTRGWTLQENILSRRKIIFTEKQVYWRCKSAVWLEETILENSKNTQIQEFLRVPGNISLHGVKASAYGTRYHEIYQRLVTAYLRRKLTYESDILNAFSGITHSLCMDIPNAFHWGITESRFSWALTWELEGEPPNQASHKSPIISWISQLAYHHPNGVRFPSWSWMAWKSGVNESRIKWSESGVDKCWIEPEIQFFREDMRGFVTPIREHRTTEKDAAIIDKRSHWKGTSRNPKLEGPHLYDGQLNDFVDSENLLFQSSAAMVCIQRSTNVDPKSPWHIFNPNTNGAPMKPSRISMGDTSHLTWTRFIKRLPSSPSSSLTEDGEVVPVKDVVFRDVLELKAHFVVIGRSVRNPEEFLQMLIVTRIGSIAYRIGCATVSEDEWMAVTNREWKLVRLG